MLAIGELHLHVSNHTYLTIITEEVSYWSQVQYVVLQGSVLGPLLFILYMLPLGDIIKKPESSYTDSSLSVFLWGPMKHTNSQN